MNDRGWAIEGLRKDGNPYRPGRYWSGVSGGWARGKRTPSFRPIGAVDPQVFHTKTSLKNEKRRWDFSGFKSRVVPVVFGATIGKDGAE